jgi:hypothetical protein
LQLRGDDEAAGDADGEPTDAAKATARRRNIVGRSRSCRAHVDVLIRRDGLQGEEERSSPR